MSFDAFLHKNLAQIGAARSVGIYANVAVAELRKAGLSKNCAPKILKIERISLVFCNGIKIVFTISTLFYFASISSN
ncbi:hypothetical protein [Treponema pectinovorum]|uniref:hypothetical protein n=1 Tax=Treponema pectinovorum TaxID=164 RepID=UPI0011C76740|nr:hypothetical protein [Treponema pectinovorum]